MKKYKIIDADGTAAASSDEEREFEWEPSKPSPRRTRSGRRLGQNPNRQVASSSSRSRRPGYLGSTAASSARARGASSSTNRANPSEGAGGAASARRPRDWGLQRPLESLRPRQNMSSPDSDGAAAGRAARAPSRAGRSDGAAARGGARSLHGGRGDARSDARGAPPARGFGGRFHFGGPPPAAAEDRGGGRASSASDARSSEGDGGGASAGEDPQLRHLLRRLRGERAANFAGPAGDDGSELDAARARYLLEASAGNVGLASALYWEDYLAEAGGAPAAAGAAGGSAAAAAAAARASSPRKRKSGDVDFGPSDEDAARPASKRARRGLKSEGLDDEEEGEEDDARKPPALDDAGGTLRSMRRWQRELEEFERSGYRRSTAGSARSGGELGAEDDAAEAALRAAMARAARPGAAAAGGELGAGLEAAAAEAAAQRDYLRLLQHVQLGGYGADAAAYGGLGSPGGRQPLSMLFPNWHAAYGAGAAGGAAAAAAADPALSNPETHREWQDAAAAALRSAGAPGGAAAALGQLAYPPLLPGGGGDDGYDALARAYESLARAPGGAGGGGGAGDADVRAEVRALLADERARNDARVREAIARVQASHPAFAAAAGGAGGGDGGGGDDDDDDDDSGSGDDRARRDDDDADEPNARDDEAAAEEDDDAEGGNPPRRSARLRSARRAGGRAPAPLRAGRNPPAAAAARGGDAGDDAPAGWAARPDNEVSDDVSEEEDLSFLPGPVPVFRLKRGKGGTASPAKRPRGDGGRGEAKCESDGGDSASDDDGRIEADVDKLLHPSDAHRRPSRSLWESYPRPGDDGEGDDGDMRGDERVHIPSSWLRSGFKLSACGNGLELRGSSSDDESERAHRRPPPHALKHGRLKGVKTLFPYNCKGVSALLSIVTALIYSGASIQGGATVTCDADKVPFAELELEQRKRQFDARLVDALSSLVCIAAAAGRRRCENKLARYDGRMTRLVRKGKLGPEEEDDYQTKRLALQRRCGMCQVCWWEASDGAPVFPEGRDPLEVEFHTSFTAAEDLRSYVKTHLRSFKEPGGCALFLETILRAHGPLAEFSGLLHCRCKESLAHLAKGNDTSKMPEDHDCVTPQLLSLLLTGELHSSFGDWSADALGIGYLRMRKDNSAPTNARLLRPVKPIWICLGDLGHSVLLSPDPRDRNCLADRPAAAFRLSHWNCWTGDLSSFTVVTSMYEDEPFRVGGGRRLHLISDTEHEGRTIADSISANIHIEEQRDAPLPWTDDNGAHANPDLKPISDEELESVASHPEDEKYYPGQYRRWRFHFGGTDATAASDDGWIPFYRLRGRQRLVVEMKLAPRICGIVRGRWPAATVREFAPSFPVV